MNGILLIDKPSGWTSNDVVQKLRGILHERRVGHAGTLDPMATGLLTVFIGRATRAVEFAEGDSKRYLASLRSGLTTDTQDITGTTLRESPQRVTREELERVLPQFTGRQLQIPPMYSAVKVDGQRLYRLARNGKTVNRPAREITVESLNLVGPDGEDWQLDIRCSKGTYIRTLCHDIGEALGCGGCLSALRRTEVGAFRVDDAFPLEAVQEAAWRGEAERLLLPVDSLFRKYPLLTVSGDEEKRVRNGGAFRSTAQEGPTRLYAENGEFLALGAVSNGSCRVIKSFFEVEDR